jgi:hypothetical protein
MKKIFMLLIVLCLIGCSLPPVEKTNTVYTAGQVVDTSNGIKITMNQKVYPNTSFVNFSMGTDDPSIYEIAGSTGGNGYLDIQQPKTKADFSTVGNVYWNNSFYADGVIHILDFSGITNNQKALVYFDVNWIDGDNASDTASFYFRAAGSSFQWQQANVSKNNPCQMAMLTNETGLIEWKQMTGNPYDAITKDATPGFHAYHRVNIDFYAEYIIVGISVK